MFGKSATSPTTLKDMFYAKELLTEEFMQHAKNAANPEDGSTSMEVSSNPNEEKGDDKVETDQWP